MERFDLLLNNFEALNKELRIVNSQLKKEHSDIFTTMVENSPWMVAILQHEKIVYINSSGLSILHGSKSAELLDRNYLELVEPSFLDAVNSALAHPEPETSHTLLVQMKGLDGSEIYTEQKYYSFQYNHLPAVLLFVREITGEISSKQVLEQEKKLRTDILNAFSEVIAYYSPTHDVLWLNEAGRKQLNIHDDSYIGTKCYKLWFNAKKHCHTCPVVHNHYETTERIVTFADRRIWKIRNIPLYNQEKITGFIEFREDITEKERIKIELEKSHSRQIRAEIANAFGHFENDLTQGKHIWSPGAYNILGIPYPTHNSDATGDISQYVHPEDAEQVKFHLAQSYAGKKKFDLIYRIIDVKGKTKTVREIGEVKNDPLNGNLIFFGVVQDISYISLLEKQILDEREKYKMLAEHAPLGLILTQNSKTVYINKTCMNWLGIQSMTEFEDTRFLQFFHANDRKIATRLLAKIKNNDIPVPIVEKLRMVDPDGQVRYIRFDLKNNRINGKKYVQSVLIDITDDVVKEKKQKQVAADALYINQKNSILAEIENVLEKTLSDKKLLPHKKEFKRIFDIIDSYKQLDKDWKMLVANFEEVHPGFFKKLTDTFPLLSPNDIKHCACIKMNFDTKEIARFFNIKASSVQISRVRLKKKMNLTDDTDLRSFLLNF